MLNILHCVLALNNFGLDVSSSREVAESVKQVKHGPMAWQFLPPSPPVSDWSAGHHADLWLAADHQWSHSGVRRREQGRHDGAWSSQGWTSSVTRYISFQTRFCLRQSGWLRLTERNSKLPSSFTSSVPHLCCLTFQTLWVMLTTI